MKNINPLNNIKRPGKNKKARGRVQGLGSGPNHKNRNSYPWSAYSCVRNSFEKGAPVMQEGKRMLEQVEAELDKVLEEGWSEPHEFFRQQRNHDMGDTVRDDLGMGDGHPINGDFLKVWVSDPSKELWTAQELASDPQIGGDVRTNASGVEYVDASDAFIRLIDGSWQGFQKDAGYNPDQSDRELSDW